MRNLSKIYTFIRRIYSMHKLCIRCRWPNNAHAIQFAARPTTQEQYGIFGYPPTIIDIYHGARVYKFFHFLAVCRESFRRSNFTLKTSWHQRRSRAFLLASFAPSFLLSSLHGAHWFSRSIHSLSTACFFWNKKIVNIYARLVARYSKTKHI